MHFPPDLVVELGAVEPVVVDVEATERDDDAAPDRVREVDALRSDRPELEVDDVRTQVEKGCGEEDPP